MNKEFNFKKWSEKYHNKEVVELKKYFTIENFNTISKLGIKIKDKIYTQYEFEVLSMDILAFYIDDDMTAEEIEFTKDLKETGVSKEEYDNLLEKIEEINKLYNFKKNRGIVENFDKLCYKIYKSKKILY